MAKQNKKRKFSNNQPVVIRFSERKKVGKVVLVRPVGKRFIYDVLCEDGKLYQELDVDVSMNECIDTYLTRLFYQKYGIDENAIPEIEEDAPALSVKQIAATLIEEPVVEEEEAPFEMDEEVLFDEEDLDPNY